MAIDRARVTFKVAKYYTGKEITFTADEMSVEVNRIPLEMNKDFEIVSYSNNIKKGKATVTIKGIGSYAGTKTFSFSIKPQAMKWFSRLFS